MKLNSSAKLSREDWVMGERGSRIFCCMSRAYIHRVMHRSKCPMSAYTAPLHTITGMTFGTKLS